MTNAANGQRTTTASRARLIGLTDIAIALGLPPLMAISWLVPRRLRKPIARIFAPFYGIAQSMDSRSTVTRRRRRVMEGHAPAGAMESAIRDEIAEDIVALLELLSCYRPGGWRPEIQVPGAEHVEKALAEGRGVILWVGHFVHGDLVVKMGFHRAGLAVSHLSHPRHGFSSSRLGMRYLNRVQTAIEDRYLRERVRMGPDGAGAAMKTLAERIADNGVVSISVRGDSRNPAVLPFFNGEIRIAAGAPVLAYNTGAALFPVFPVRDSGGGFTVFIEPALEIDRALDRRAAIGVALDRYVELLKDYVLRYPDQWKGWFNL